MGCVQTHAAQHEPHECKEFFFHHLLPRPPIHHHVTAHSRTLLHVTAHSCALPNATAHSRTSPLSTAHSPTHPHVMALSRTAVAILLYCTSERCQGLQPAISQRRPVAAQACKQSPAAPLPEHCSFTIAVTACQSHITAATGLLPQTRRPTFAHVGCSFGRPA